MNYGREIHSKTKLKEVQHTGTHSHSLKLNKGERRKAQLGEEKRSLCQNLSCWSFFL